MLQAFLIAAIACALGLLVYVAREMRSQGQAFERFAHSTVGLLRASVVVSNPRTNRSTTRDVTLDSSRARSERREGEGVIVAIEFSPSTSYDTESGRWLREIVGGSLPAGETRREDTPAPEGQRFPILPPLSSSRPRHSRR